MLSFKVSSSDFNSAPGPMRAVFLKDSAGNLVPASTVSFAKASAQLVAASLPPAEFGVKAMVYGAFPGSFVIGTESQSGALCFNSCPSDQPGVQPWPASIGADQAVLVCLE